MFVKTSRLHLTEINSDFLLIERERLLEQIVNILTPNVVSSLPSYFQGVDSVASAGVWLDRMLAESRLFLVSSLSDDIIGFIFVFVDKSTVAHLGYLLAEDYWGRGYASEMMQAFIRQVKQSEKWIKLVGGVARSNVASAKLLKKLGFKEQAKNSGDTVFFEYVIFKSPNTR